MEKVTEHDAQVALIKWFRIKYKDISNCLFAIPNGGLRHYKVALKLKREGVLAGVSDLFLMIPKDKWHGCFIEMKIEKGRLSDKQKDFLDAAQEQGYFTIVGYGFLDASKKIEDYLKLE